MQGENHPEFASSHQAQVIKPRENRRRYRPALFQNDLIDPSDVIEPATRYTDIAPVMSGFEVLKSPGKAPTAFDGNTLNACNWSASATHPLFLNSENALSILKR